MGQPLDVTEARHSGRARGRKTVARAAWLWSLHALLLLAPPAWAQRNPDVPEKMFLVANEAVQDPFFRQSVVLIVPGGSAGGIIGLIINRPTTFPFGRLFPHEKSLQARRIPVHFGGPVSLAAPAFLVRSKNQPAKLLHLFEDVYLGTDIDVLKRLVKRANSDAGFRVYLGHAGWSVDQLGGEIAGGGWYVVPADATTVFATKPEALWPTLLARARMRPVTVRRALSLQGDR